MTRIESEWVARADLVARQTLARQAAEVDQQGRWPEEGIAALAEAGLLGLTVPLSCGGPGAGPRTFAAVVRALAEQCASTAMIYLMHVCATQVLSAADRFAQREPILRAIVAGRHLGTLAFSERGSRSHFWAPVSQEAVRENRCWLSAEKSFVTSAGNADSYVVSTRSAAATDALTSTLYYVPRDAPGLMFGAPWNGMGLRGNASAPVRLDEVSVPLTSRLSGDGEGLGVMLKTVLPWFQLGSAAVSVGIARAATEGIRQHLATAQLEHLGQPLAALPNLRARLAEMQVAVDTQQAFLEHVAGRMEDAASDSLLPVLESKVSAAEAALAVTDLAMRTGGGAAFGRHLTIERNFRDARAASVMAPTTDILYDFIGKSLLNMPLL